MNLVPYNVIVTGDLHTNDYKTYNPVPEFRLNQYITLANVIVETAIKHNCKELWIAGDLLVSPKPHPKVMNYLKQFMTIITNAGIIIRFVYGNHDLLIKNKDTDIKEYAANTHLSLLHNGINIFAYDSELVNIEGNDILFSSWRPNNEVAHQKARYLVCHGDVDSRISPFINNYISTDNYDRVISGHIHTPLDTPKFISPSVPIPHSFGDVQETSLVIFDVNNNISKREYIHKQFLTFVYAKTKEEKTLIEAEYKERNQHVFVRVKTKSSKAEVVNMEDVRNLSMTELDLDPRQVLRLFTSKLSPQVADLIHSAINSSSENEDEMTVPNLRFELLSLKAKNFLSIRDIDFDFTDLRGLTAIIGEVGSGKSTLLNLILFMLKGSLSTHTVSDYNLVYSEKFSGSMSLMYEDKKYTIRRGLSSLKVWIDGVPVDDNNKRDLQKDLESRLKFISFLNLLYIKQESKGIFSSMSDTSRITLLTRLIGLSLVNKWTKLVKSVVTEKESEITKLEKEINDNKIKISSNTSHIETFYSNVKELMDPTPITDRIEFITKTKLVELDNKLDELNSKTYSIQSSIEKIHSDKHKLSEWETNFRELTTIDLVNLDNKISEKTSLIESLNFSDKLEGLANLLQGEITETQSVLSKLTNDSIPEKMLRKKAIEKDLNHFKNHPDKCNTCEQDWIIKDKDERIKTLDLRLVDVNGSISRLNSSKELINSELLLLNTKLTDTKNRISKFPVESKLKDELLSSRELLATKISLLKEKIDSYKDPVEELAKYNLDKSNVSNEIAEVKSSKNTFNSELNQLNVELNNIKHNNDSYEKLLVLKQKTIDLEELNKKISSDLPELVKVFKELDRFCTKILTDKGLLIAAMLEKVAEYLNQDELLQVTTVEQLQNGSVKPSLNLKLYVEKYDKYIDYGFLSGGQRLQADLRFLSGISKTLGSIEFIMLDEVFKFFSNEVISESAEILKTMDVSKIFLIIHGSSPEEFANNILNVRLTENGSVYERLY